MDALVERLDHIDIVVKDLDQVKDFFLALGFAQEDQSRLAGSWISAKVGS